MQVLITKSRYLKGRQCARRFWLAIHGIAEPQIESEDVWSEREEEGEEVERFAARLFDAPVQIDASKDDESIEVGTLRVRADRTAVAAKSRRTILQACLLADDLMAIADVLEPLENGWRLWEVKASTNEKPVHDWDLGYQWVVARRAGIDVREAGLILLNKEFVRTSADILPEELLRRVDRTAVVTALLPVIEGELTDQLEVASAIAMPAERPAGRCWGSRTAKEGNRPSDCGHLDRSGICGRELPQHWVGTLPKLMGKKAVALFAMEVPSIELLDPDDKDARWTDDQVRCIRAVRGSAPVIDRDALAAELQALEWPVTYIDFEFDPGMAVPRFVGTRPYDKIPFQWSMLVQQTPDAEPTEVEPFLHLDESDPREHFARALLRVLPNKGSIVAHHASTEIEVITKLAVQLGGELGSRLNELPSRFFDTEMLARAGYCHADMEGSWSIKNLAPALLGRGYEDLSIQNGMAAVVAWKKALALSSQVERESARAELLAYCGRDTALMRELVDRLGQLAES